MKASPQPVPVQLEREALELIGVDHAAAPALAQKLGVARRLDDDTPTGSLTSRPIDALDLAEQATAMQRPLILSDVTALAEAAQYVAQGWLQATGRQGDLEIEVSELKGNGLVLRIGISRAGDLTKEGLVWAVPFINPPHRAELAAPVVLNLRRMVEQLDSMSAAIGFPIPAEAKQV